jgi:PHD/YefM family antitoxin component YafN of YafNO toxin-antitoxin module
MPDTAASPSSTPSQEKRRTLVEYLDTLLHHENPQKFHEDFTKISAFRWLKEIPDWKNLDGQYRQQLVSYTTDFPNSPAPQARTRLPSEPGEPSTEGLPPLQFLNRAGTFNSTEEYETFYREHFAYSQGTVKPVSPGKIALFCESQALPLSIEDNSPENFARLYSLANSNGIAPNGLIPTPEEVAQHGMSLVRESFNRFSELTSTEYHEREFQKNPDVPPDSPAARAMGMPPDPKALYSNFVKAPYTPGTTVPAFGVMQAGSLKVIEGSSFLHTEDAGHTIALRKPGAAGPQTIRIPSTLYESIIKNASIPAQSKEPTPEAIKKYEELTNADANKPRNNTAANFWHNYRVLCRQHAQNPVMAVNVARDILKGMRLEERDKFISSVHSYEKVKGQSYNERLLRYYQDVVKDIPIQNRTVHHESALSAMRHNDDSVNTPGKRIDEKLRIKIGDEVKLNLSIPDLLSGNPHKSVKSGLLLTAVSKDLNKVVLMDKNGLSKYVISRDDFIKRMEQVEKRQGREAQKLEKRQRRRDVLESVGYLQR